MRERAEKSWTVRSASVEAECRKRPGPCVCGAHMERDANWRKYVANKAQEPQPAPCAECGNPSDEHGGPLYAHRYVTPPRPSPRTQGGEPEWPTDNPALQPFVDDVYGRERWRAEVKESVGSEAPDHFREAGEMVPEMRAVVGALSDTINTHGPITRQWVGSAAKRILGSLRGASAEPDVESVARRMAETMAGQAHDYFCTEGCPNKTHAELVGELVRAALAKRSEPAQDFRISPDPREDEF